MNDRFYQLSEGKQNRIISAGFRVFSRYSYKNSPMSEIAAEAGISKSLLFYYFKNKKELYLFLCKCSTELTEKEMIRQKCFEKEDFFDTFLSGLKVKVQLMRQYPDLSLFQLKAYYEMDRSLRPEIDKIIGKYSGYDNQSEMLKLDKERFIEGLDLEMMYMDMFLVSQG